ncbi:MAG: hypothetical protein LPK18_08425 [Pseudomonadaceae bacterium]|nr:hypothetical protein [Pseudomonadaceae bacterium]
MGFILGKPLGLAVVLGTLTLSMLQAPAVLAGEILILRDVPTRVATREGPGQAAPVTVDISPDQHVQRSFAPIEPLGDAEFATVTGGAGNGLRIDTSLHQGIHGIAEMRGISGALGNAPRHGGGAIQNVGGQINRSIQQGLKPLQNLGGR